MSELENQINEFIAKSEDLKRQEPSSPVFLLWKKAVERFVEDNYGQSHLDIFKGCFGIRMFSYGPSDQLAHHQQDLTKAIEFLTALKSEPVKTSNQREKDTDHDAIKKRTLEWMMEYQHNRPTVEPTAQHIATQLQEFRREDVIASVYFLNDEKWLKKRSVKGVDHFRLSSKAMDYFSPSQYKSHPASRVQITASNSILIMGDNLGSVEQSNAEGIAQLDGLIEKILASTQVSQENKLNAVADADTIKSQLLKTKPNNTIIRAAWATVETAAVVSGAVDFAAKVAHLIGIR